MPGEETYFFVLENTESGGWRAPAALQLRPAFMILSIPIATRSSSTRRKT